MDFYGLEWTLNECLRRCVLKETRQNKKTPEILSGARSMEQVKGILRSQGACPLRGACGVLDGGFPGVRLIIHPDPNPL